MASSNLSTIEQKVRLLTRSPSQNQLSDSQLRQYINTFVLYDFPEHVRLFNLRTTFSFYTQPYIDVYETNTTDTTSPLYNFINKYLTVEQPIYIAGYQVPFFEDRTQFFALYPLLNSIASIGITGDGTTQQFSGVINSQQALVPSGMIQNIALLRNNVLFSSIDSNFNGLSLIDTPISASIGNLSVPNAAPTSLVTQDINNYVNYVTGEFTITFPAAPAIGASINSQSIPQTLALPKSLLFYDGKFTVRPVPDQPYKIDMEVYVQPAELLSSNDNPKLNEWWQYIAYGAAKKVFEDRMDLDSVQQIMPEFKQQERLCLRRTLKQQASQRSSTIYSVQTSTMGSYGPGFFSGTGY